MVLAKKKPLASYTETKSRKHSLKTRPLLGSDDVVDKKSLYNEIFDLFELGKNDLNAYQLRLKLANFESLYGDFSDTAIETLHHQYDWKFMTDDYDAEFAALDPQLLDVSNDPYWDKRYHRYLLTTTTHDIQPSYIGRNVRFLVIDKYKKEKYNRNYVLGFIILTSPLVYSMNRNQYFFKDGMPDKMKLVNLLNKYFITGSVIVPTQSFGKFLLGGKLLALLSLSKEAADIWDETYGHKSQAVIFETTSLYADRKENSVSMYDALDKYLKKVGITDSTKVLLHLPKGISQKINKIISTFHQEWYKKNIETVAIANSPKQKIYKKFLTSEFLPYFKEHEPEKYEIIRQRLKNNEWSAHSRKNTYEFIAYPKEQILQLLQEKITMEELEKQPRRVDNSIAAVVSFWRNKAAKRLEKKRDEIREALANNTWAEFYTRKEMKHGPRWQIIR